MPRTDPQVMLVMEFVPLGSLTSYLRTYDSKDFKRSEPINLMKFASDIAEGRSTVFGRL